MSSSWRSTHDHSSALVSANRREPSRAGVGVEDFEAAVLGDDLRDPRRDGAVVGEVDRVRARHHAARGPHESTVSAAPSASRSAPTTIAPSRAKRSAAARPCPLPVPVMTATRPARRPVIRDPARRGRSRGNGVANPRRTTRTPPTTGDLGARDVRGEVRQQKRDDFGDLGRRGDAAERRQADVRVAHHRGGVRHERRLDIAGVHDVDADAAARRVRWRRRGSGPRTPHLLVVYATVWCALSPASEPTLNDRRARRPSGG